jgi:ketosteroid isomerase-like protein
MSSTRRSVLAAAPAIIVGGGASNPSHAAPQSPGMPTDADVLGVLSLAEQAHEALMSGDVVRYRSLMSFSDDFTLMTPFGGTPTRPVSLTDEQWNAIGRLFRNGRDSKLDLVQAYRAVDQIVLVGLERSYVEVGGLPAQDWVLRVTLVFSRQGGRWVLAHRHADGLAGGISLPQAAVFAVGTSAATK